MTGNEVHKSWSWTKASLCVATGNMAAAELSNQLAIVIDRSTECIHSPEHPVDYMHVPDMYMMNIKLTLTKCICINCDFPENASKSNFCCHEIC